MRDSKAISMRVDEAEYQAILAVRARIGASWSETLRFLVSQGLRVLEADPSRFDGYRAGWAAGELQARKLLADCFMRGAELTRALDEAVARVRSFPG